MVDASSAASRALPVLPFVLCVSVSLWLIFKAMATVRIDTKGAVAILRMDKARGNSIDEPLTRDLIQAAADLTADPAVRGVLLTSAHPKLFSPGLDLVTLIELDRKAMERFMLLFADMVWALYGLAKPMVAGVNGHAVAGGCILALTADYRVLRRGGAQIGLNEVRVGLPLPWTVTELLRASVPGNALSQVALLGRNFADDEALRVGLADELADAAGFEDHCLLRLDEFVEKDGYAVATTKAALRHDVLAAMKAHEARRIGPWLDGWFSDRTRSRMRELAAGLSKPR
jgi:enoyl-CoA hydratase